MRRHFAGVSLVGCVLLFAVAAGAAPFTWTGASTAGTAWSDGSNWDGGVAPTAWTSPDVTVTGGTAMTMDQYYLAPDTLTFNVDNDFTIGGQFTWTYTGINVMPTTTTPRRYAFTNQIVTQFSSKAQTYNVGAGSTLAFTGQYADGGYWGFTKTGAGDMEISFLYGGNINVQQGALKIISSGVYYRFRGLTIADGATVAPLGGNINIEANNAGPGDYNIQGTLGSLDYTTSISDQLPQQRSTMTFSGNGKFVNGSSNYLGNVVFDDRTVHLTDRYANTGWYPMVRSEYTLIGNDSTDSQVPALWSGSYAMLNGRGSFQVIHGLNASANISLGTFGTVWGPGMLVFGGNDFNGSGTYTSSVTVGSLPSVYTTGGTYVSPISRVGMEFATVNGSNHVIAYDGTGRIHDVAAAVANDNVLADQAQSALMGNTTCATLKIDGDFGINVNGSILQIGSGLAGGLIQTGSNNTAGIHDNVGGGMLRTGNSGDLPLVVMNDRDFEISVPIQASRILKDGTGTLTISGTLLGDNRIRWYEGSLTYKSPTDGILEQETRGDGKLIKDGPSTLTAAGDYNYCGTGSIEVRGGTFVLSGNMDLGQALLTVFAGATYQHNNAAIRHVVLSGGKMIVNGGWTDGGSVLENAPGTTGQLQLQTATKFYGLLGSGTLGKTGPGGLYLAPAMLGSPFAGTIHVKEGKLYAMDPGEYGWSYDSTLPIASKLLLDPGTSLCTGNYWGNSLKFKTETIAGKGTIDCTMGNSSVYFQGTTLMPGDTGVGTLTINGGAGAVHFQQNPASSAFARLIVDVLSPANYDILATNVPVDGLDNLDLVVNLAAGQNYAGAVLTILTCSNDLTSSATLHSVALTNHYLGDVAYGVGGVALYNIRHLPGDANGDGLVDQADYTIWYNNYGASGATWSQGDFTGEGLVDQADYTIWYNNYGATNGSVPEPMTMALLAIGGMALLRRRK